MKLIIGQGNPGPDYHQTRHNIGFMLIDAIAEHRQLSWSLKARFKANVADFTNDNHKVLFIKPATFYNLTGESARALCDFYKIAPSDVLVIHDELALPFGTLRTRIGGSDAGNNGIKNLIAHLGPHFARIRVGIANDRTALVGAHDFVLGRFTKDELQAFDHLVKEVDSFVNDFIHEDHEFALTSKRIT